MSLEDDIHHASFGESRILDMLTSQKPHERQIALSLIIDFERLLIDGDVDGLSFQRLFRECQMKYKDMEEQ